jgi:hypothetical protein
MAEYVVRHYDIPAVAEFSRFGDEGGGPRYLPGHGPADGNMLISSEEQVVTPPVRNQRGDVVTPARLARPALKYRIESRDGAVQQIDLARVSPLLVLKVIEDLLHTLHETDPARAFLLEALAKLAE